MKPAAFAAALEAAKLTVEYARDTLIGGAPADVIIVRKGEPSILVCVEPMMSLHVTGPVDDRRPEGKASILFDLLGPLSRIAIAHHLGLSPVQARARGLTIEAARQALEVAANEVAKKLGADGPCESIEPTDPRWGATMKPERPTFTPPVRTERHGREFIECGCRDGTELTGTPERRDEDAAVFAARHRHDGDELPRTKR